MIVCVVIVRDDTYFASAAIIVQVQQMAHQLHIRSADGRPVLIRPLVPADEKALGETIAKFSSRSRYLRFFSNLTPVPETIVRTLCDVDGDKHLAWGAIDESQPDNPIVGAVHVMRGDSSEPTGEFAIGLLDDWHSQGLARLLIAILCAHAEARGITSMNADVLWENRRGRALMKAIGARSTGSDASVVSYRFDVSEALDLLRNSMRGAAMEATFDAIETGSLVSDAA